MRKLLPVLLVGSALVGYLAGSAGPSIGSAAAQQPAPARQPVWATIPLSPNQGQPAYWSGDDLKKVHTTLAARSNGRILSKPFDLIKMPFTRTHYFDVVHRPPTPTPTAEWHDGVTDVYFVFGGSGTITVGGEIENRRMVPDRPGEFLGTLKGGQSYKVKAGDVLTIPPSTAHASVGDAGGLTYILLKINVGLYPWSIVSGAP